MIDPLNYELRISLVDVHPEVWRVFRVSSFVPLRKLHKIIQQVMGWENYHLYAFERAGIVFGSPDPDYVDPTISDLKIHLYSVLTKVGDELTYTYDFGDGWQHKIVLQKILPAEADVSTPLCLDGAYACPPEDVGGVGGYANYAAIMRNPKDEEYEEYFQWRGAFDPAAFDLSGINRKLKRIKV